MPLSSFQIILRALILFIFLIYGGFVLFFSIGPHTRLPRISENEMPALLDFQLEGKRMMELAANISKWEADLLQREADLLRREAEFSRREEKAELELRQIERKTVQSIIDSALLSDIPGPTYNHELFLHSVLITKGHYEDHVYVDVFAIAKDYFIEKKGEKKGNKWVRISDRPKGIKLLEQDMYNKLDDNVARWKRRLHCLVALPNGTTLSTPATFIPRFGSQDGNVDGHTHIMRCKVTELIPPSTLHQRKLISVLLTRGKCPYSDQYQTQGCSVIASLKIPLPSGIAGMFTPKYAGSTFGNYQRGPNKMVNATLCAPGAQSADLLFVEFVEYHRMIGFDHIYIGVHRPWGNRKIKEFQALLAPAISAGYVTLHSTWTERLEFGDEGKQFFMHMCLYHSKRMSRWTAVFDADEFATPHTPNKTVMDIINYANDFGRKEICWVQLTSFSVLTRSTDEAALNSIWPTAAWIKKGPADERWKKSIANTEKSFTSGYHIPGTCNHSNPKIYFGKKILQGWPDYADFVGLVDPSAAAMHHFVNAYRQRFSPWKNQTEDEFGKYYFQRVIKRIEDIDPNYWDWQSRYQD